MVHRCSPPYYPSAGHEDQGAHDTTSSCVYYAVWAGRVRGVYSNSWIARAQTDSYTDARHKGFRKWADVLEWWRDLCAQHHQGGCPAFEPVIFTLNPSNSTHPSSTPCTTVAPAAPPVYVNAPAGTHFPGATPAAIAAAAAPYQAPAPSAAAVAAAPGPSGADAIAPAGSPFVASPSNVKKEEESSPPTLHLNLTPTGRARADMLHGVAHPAPCLGARAEGRRVRDDRPNDNHGEAVERFYPAPRPSVLVTPVAPAAAPGLAPAPAAPAPPALPVVQYGIRGVSVFYSSHAAASGAARRLELDNPRIMMTSNIEKLESWMRGDPFVGEDDDA
ncbi:hypothetical protein B0H14DRAFT_3490007 [Mycena olivaceomarginata]|nr:hypothetical protein B0H14DRAFT_3490007 [Mycena olivaceomarginata]